MNEINGFTFYRNYFEFYENLEDADRLILADTIFNYMFKDLDPINLNGMVSAIWTNIKMPLNNTKVNIINGSKGGRPKTQKDSQNKTQSETKKKPKKEPKKKPNNISTFLFLISNFILENNYNDDTKLTIEEWINYKQERKEDYTETGFKKLLTQIKNNISKYGEEKVCNLINHCMASNWKGIIFGILDQQTEKQEGSNNPFLDYAKEEGIL